MKVYSSKHQPWIMVCAFFRRCPLIQLKSTRWPDLALRIRSAYRYHRMQVSNNNLRSYYPDSDLLPHWLLRLRTRWLISAFVRGQCGTSFAACGICAEEICVRVNMMLSDIRFIAMYLVEDCVVKEKRGGSWREERHFLFPRLKLQPILIFQLSPALQSSILKAASIEFLTPPRQRDQFTWA